MVGAPFIALTPRRASGAPTRRWSVAGERVEGLDGLDDAMQHFMQHHGIRSGALAVARSGKPSPPR